MTAQRTTMKIDFNGLHECILIALEREDFSEVNNRIESMLGYKFDAKAWFEDVLDNQGVVIWDELTRNKQNEIVTELIHDKAPSFAKFEYY